MKIPTNIIQLLVDVILPQAEVRFNDVWKQEEALWKINILSDVISDLSRELEVVTEEYEREMDVLRNEVASMDRHLKIVKSKGEVS